MHDVLNMPARIADTHYFSPAKIDVEELLGDGAWVVAADDGGVDIIEDLFAGEGLQNLMGCEFPVALKQLLFGDMWHIGSFGRWKVMCSLG